MLKKLTRSLLLYAICFGIDAYSMECPALFKIDDIQKSYPLLVQQIHSELMESIKTRNRSEFSLIIYKLKLYIPRHELWLVLDKFDKETGYSPLTLAKTLPKDEIRSEIIRTIKNLGAAHTNQKKDCISHLKALDANFRYMQKTLMESINTGSIHKVTSTLKDLYQQTTLTIKIGEHVVIDKIQFIILLNEIDAETGHSPLTFAQEKGVSEIEQLLKRYGALSKTNNNIPLIKRPPMPPATCNLFKMLNLASPIEENNL